MILRIHLSKGGSLPVENVQFVLYMKKQFESFSFDCSAIECSVIPEQEKTRIRISLKNPLASTAPNSEGSIAIKVELNFTEIIDPAKGQFLRPIVAVAFQSSAVQTSVPLQINRETTRRRARR